MQFYKFPRTPHLFVLPGLKIRDDKVLSMTEADELLRQEVIIEEKVDGANLGISIHADGALKIQNRGNYIAPGDHPQFDPLWSWAYERLPLFQECLKNQYILFGEWCYATHSLHYEHLVDWFLGFDVYDRSAGKFLASSYRNEVFDKMRVNPVPLIKRGIVTKQELCVLIDSHNSSLRKGKMEGVYLRWEDERWLHARAKLVRQDFVQSIGEHWFRAALTPNELA